MPETRFGRGVLARHEDRDAATGGWKRLCRGIAVICAAQALGLSVPGIGWAQDSAQAPDGEPPIEGAPGEVGARERCAAIANIDWAVTRASEDEIEEAVRLMQVSASQTGIRGILVVLPGREQVVALADRCEDADRLREVALSAPREILFEAPTVVTAPPPSPVVVERSYSSADEADSGEAGAEDQAGTREAP